jgi:preprotein translocase subunit SecB
MVIKLTNWKVLKSNFSVNFDETRHDNSFDLNINQIFKEEVVSNEFGIIFKIEIRDKEFDLYVEFVYNFEADSEITDEFKNSNFPKINAPAIAFPFLRAFISNFTLQAGYEPVILPSINFVELSNSTK